MRAIVFTAAHESARITVDLSSNNFSFSFADRPGEVYIPLVFVLYRPLGLSLFRNSDVSYCKSHFRVVILSFGFSSSNARLINLVIYRSGEWLIHFQR